jgi:hypothetical protein
MLIVLASKIGIEQLIAAVESCEAFWRHVSPIPTGCDEHPVSVALHCSLAAAAITNLAMMLAQRSVSRDRLNAGWAKIIAGFSSMGSSFSRDRDKQQICALQGLTLLSPKPGPLR